jgi:hypothetical protein
MSMPKPKSTASRAKRDLSEQHEELDHTVGLGDVPAGEDDCPCSGDALDTRYQRRRIDRGRTV